MRHDWRWFGRLEQEDQKLKKHYSRWMDIVRRPFRWVPHVRWRNNYFARNKEALPCRRLDPAVSLSTYSILPMEVGR